jgi:hypothetical protein
MRAYHLWNLLETYSNLNLLRPPLVLCYFCPGAFYLVHPSLDSVKPVQQKLGPIENSKIRIRLCFVGTGISGTRESLRLKIRRV